MITKEDVINIIKKEGLKRINWFEEELRENEVGIRVERDQWIVFATDERASIITGSIIKFNNESEALENFLARAMTEKSLF